MAQNDRLLTGGLSLDGVGPLVRNSWKQQFFSETVSDY